MSLCLSSFLSVCFMMCFFFFGCYSLFSWFMMLLSGCIISISIYFNRIWAIVILYFWLPVGSCFWKEKIIFVNINLVAICKKFNHSLSLTPLMRTMSWTVRMKNYIGMLIWIYGKENIGIREEPGHKEMGFKRSNEWLPQRKVFNREEEVMTTNPRWENESTYGGQK